MGEFEIKKPDTGTAEIVECQDKGYEQMDPLGYFLIRINEGRLEAGLCDYQNVNKIKKIWTSSSPQNIYRQIIEDLPDLAKDHAAYLAKELTRAWICMKLGVKYVQDGKIDGTFPEIDWLERKENAPQ